MTQTENAGLAGVLRSAANSARSINTDPLLWMVRLVLGAGFVLIYKKSAANPDWTDAAVVLMLGSAALMAEYYMGGEMVRAWRDRAIVRLFGAVAVYVAVLGYAGLQWTGTASEMEADKTGAQKAAHYASEIATTEVDRLRGKVVTYKAEYDRIHMERWAPLPTVDGKVMASAAEARAVLEGQKNQTRFWNLTAECTKSAGAQTRAFVKTCTEAKAAIAASEARESKQVALEAAEKNLQQAEADFAKAKQTKQTTKTVTNNSRDDLRMLVAYAGMSEQAAMDLSAAWKIIIISFLACVLGMMIKAREYRDQPKKAWPFMIRLRRLIYGGPSPSVDPVSGYAAPATGNLTVVHNTERIEDTKALDALQQFVSQINARLPAPRTAKAA